MYYEEWKLIEVVKISSVEIVNLNLMKIGLVLNKWLN